ncbi:unnamed protein product [Arctogadus glacialis]
MATSAVRSRGDLRGQGSPTETGCKPNSNQSYLHGAPARPGAPPAPSPVLHLRPPSQATPLPSPARRRRKATLRAGAVRPSSLTSERNTLISPSSGGELNSPPPPLSTTVLRRLNQSAARV